MRFMRPARSAILRRRGSSQERGERLRTRSVPGPADLGAGARAEGDGREPLHGFPMLLDGSRGCCASRGQGPAQGVLARAGLGGGRRSIWREEVADLVEDLLDRRGRGGRIPTALRCEPGEAGELLAARMDTIRPVTDCRIGLGFGQAVALAGVEPLVELVLEAAEGRIARSGERKGALVSVLEQMPLGHVEEAQIPTGEGTGASLPHG